MGQAGFEGVIVQAGRAFNAEQIQTICATLKRFPKLSRSELYGTICEHLNWLTAAGNPKSTACEKLLDRLEAQGLIQLPAKRTHGYQGGPRRPLTWTTRSDPPDPIEALLAELQPVQLQMVGYGDERRLWNEYVARHHPLGYQQPFGYSVRYFIQSGDRRLGCVLIAGAAKALAARDQWIGWHPRQRLKNLPWLVNNTRLLIFPWVRVPHLASHILGQLARRLADDFAACWGFRPLLMESFVDPAHYRGVCYRAAGWALLGRTQGRGLVRPGKHYRTTPKLIFVKPLQADFRRLLCSDTLQGGLQP